MPQRCFFLQSSANFCCGERALGGDHGAMDAKVGGGPVSNVGLAARQADFLLLQITNLSPLGGLRTNSVACFFFFADCHGFGYRASGLLSPAICFELLSFNVRGRPPTVIRNHETLRVHERQTGNVLYY